MSKTVSLISTAKRKYDQGDRAEAERLLRRVLADEPAHVGATRALAGLMVDQGRYQEAYPIVGAAARRNPLDEGLRVLAGQCLQGMGSLAEAHRVFVSVLGNNPGSLPAQVGSAGCMAGLNHAFEALEILIPLHKRHPTDPDVQYTLGVTYMHLGRSSDGVEHLRTAARVRPSSRMLAQLGWALYAAGCLEEASAAFERVSEADAAQPMVAAGRATVLIDQGRVDEARGLLRETLRRFPSGIQALTAIARIARTPEQRAEARAALERGISLPYFPTHKPALLFALGSLRDADGDHDGAFESFRAANEATATPVDREFLTRSYGENRDVFSARNLARMARAHPDPLPVFIVGMPRSGTSLVEQILASHPAVHGAGELTDLSALCKQASQLVGTGQEFPACMTSLNSEQANALASGYLARLRALGGGAERVTDKMPRNYLLCGLIEVLFPGARIIHCARHPLDTCVSVYSTSLAQGHFYKHRLGDLAAEYREYRIVMDHWRRVLRVPMLDVPYEEVVADLEGWAKRLVEFIGLRWDDRCLAFHKNTRLVATASIDQVRRPVYKTSVGRWKRYEKHIGELVEGLREYL